MVTKKSIRYPLHPPETRVRIVFTADRGDVQAFVVKLEYNRNPAWHEIDDWHTVARFDHNPDPGQGHDIRDEGLHMDLCNLRGQRYDRVWGFAQVTPNEAIDYCENYFAKYGHLLAKEFERRNGIDGRWHST